jgi:hypothetical protein
VPSSSVSATIAINSRIPECRGGKLPLR